MADSGPGVPLAERHAIFQRFQQVDGPAHQRAGGTGLGLAIVRDLVDLHGATVAAGVAPEGGALFVVELPLDAAPDDEPAAPAPGPEPAERERATVEARCRRSCAPPTGGTAGRRRPSPAATSRVLLVATSDVLGLYLEELLADDLEVLHAATAAEALAVARGGRIDAAVVDAGGPGGKAVLAALRADADPPVVVLAAEARHARRLVQDEAADDYAVQPFASEELLVRLGALVGRARGVGPRECRRALPGRPRAGADGDGPGDRRRQHARDQRCAGGAARPSGRVAAWADPRRPQPPHDVLAGDRIAGIGVDGDPMRIERRLVAADGRVLTTR